MFDVTGDLRYYHIKKQHRVAQGSLKPVPCPKYSIFFDRHTDWECRKCGATILKGFDYCPCCGTKIDWRQLNE